MKSDLSFVKGAVAKKDYVPELTHFRLRAGRVSGYNGIIALSSPIDIDLECRPRALPFVKAIDTALTQKDDAVALHMTKAGRLAVKSGKFRAYVMCFEEEQAGFEALPQGEEVDVGEEFYNALTTLAPFMGQDASRPWASGIMLRSGSAYATNNICLIEYWHGAQLPEPVNIPAEAVHEILRNKQPPERVQMSESSMTFHFEGGRWLRTQLLSTDWPDAMAELLARPADLKPIPELEQALDTLKPFVDKSGHVHFRDNLLATSLHEGEGTEFELEQKHQTMTFHHSQLGLVRQVATEVDFSAFPDPCKFQGENVRGLIIGVRL